jgi:homoserine kinase type II
MHPPSPAGIWDLPKDCVVAPLDHGGYNNHLFRVDIAGRPEYVLRVYGNHSNPRLIEHELSVTLQLQRHKLPVVVPAPVFTRRGEMCATVNTDSGMKLMVLLPFLQGVNPAPSNLAQARNVGEAIALLLNAMKTVETRGLRLPPPYIELERVHPLVPEPLLALDELGSLVDKATRFQINDILDRVIGEVAGHWKKLGTQLTHGDVIPGNIMVQGDRVTAILDFENCALNPRAMDLAGALDTWLWDALGRDALWERYDALGKGFSSVNRLSRDEVAALPILILLRNANVLMHLIGRYAGGLSPFIDVESWLDTLVEIDAWLTDNCDALRERASRW